MDPKDHWWNKFSNSLASLLLGHQRGDRARGGTKKGGPGYTKAFDPRKKEKLAKSRFNKRKRLKRRRGLNKRKPDPRHR